MGQCTSEQAAEHALKWCAEHPGWQRICDLPYESDRLYKTFDELDGAVRGAWKRKYRERAEDMWDEYGKAECKVPFGFVSGAGEFFENVLDVPRCHNSMMVFKTDENEAFQVN